MKLKMKKKGFMMLSAVCVMAMLMLCPVKNETVWAAEMENVDDRSVASGYEAEQLFPGESTGMEEDTSVVLMDSGRKETSTSLVAADGTYIRDYDGRQVYSNGAEVWRQVGTYSYNADGMLASYVVYAYDASGNAINEKRYRVGDAGETLKYEIQRTYDANGNGLKSAEIYYNEDGTVSGGYVNESTYDENGNRLKHTRSYYEADVLRSQAEYTYDARGNIL